MVSNARLDLPEPESPVTTMSRSRGISSETFLRLWTRAPCTATVVRGAAFGTRSLFFTFFGVVLEPIRWFSRVEEGQFLNGEVALLREAQGHPRLAEQPLIREVLARHRHAVQVEVPLKMLLQLAG